MPPGESPTDIADRRPRGKTCGGRRKDVASMKRRCRGLRDLEFNDIGMPEHCRKDAVVRRDESVTAARGGDGPKLGSMSSRAALRHAIVMKEILGLPLALRPQDEPDPWGS